MTILRKIILFGSLAELEDDDKKESYVVKLIAEERKAKIRYSKTGHIKNIKDKFRALGYLE